MSEIMVNKYGNIISDQETGNMIFQEIKKELNSTSTPIKVNLNDVITMATFNAKQIFGKLYLELGPTNFFDKIIILNANDDLKLIISLGIQSAVND